MTEPENAPKVDDELLTYDEDGDSMVLNIDGVGGWSEDHKGWSVMAEGEHLYVRWSDSQGGWVDTDEEFD